MTYETMRLVRNLLLRTFAVGIVFVLILGFATFAGWNTWSGIAEDWLHSDPAAIMRLMIAFFLNVRFFLLFIILAPALALHWTMRKETFAEKTMEKKKSWFGK